MTEKQLLKWLAENDVNAFGECCGDTLNSLILGGMVEVHGSGIGAGVSLTEYGQRRAAETS